VWVGGARHELGTARYGRVSDAAGPDERRSVVTVFKSCTRQAEKAMAKPAGVTPGTG